MFSTPVRGTAKKKTTMNWWEYWIGHCFQTGWREIWNNFKMWRDLISGNYADYALLKDDDPYQECYEWFWCSINMDETYPKEFLEYLMQMVDDIETGKEKLIPLDEDFFDRMRDLTDGLIDDVDLDDELDEDDI